VLEERTIRGQHEVLLRTVRTLDGLSPASPILDLGCGTGAWLKRLYDAGYRDLWGADRDLPAFGAGDIAKFIAADLDLADAVIPPGKSNFELVTMIEVIEHVANPQRLVEMAARALAPDGWMLITSPNIYSLRARGRFLVRRAVPYFEQSAHSTPIELDHIHAVVLEAYQRKIFAPLNLSLVRIWTYPDSGSDGSRWFARLLTGVLRRLLRDDLPGDTLCLLLRKAGKQGDSVKPGGATRTEHHMGSSR
jgi:SAM-dependent methyltransferase